MRRILTGLSATLLLALLLVGLPTLLVLIGPVGVPHFAPTPAGIWAALMTPDDGTLFLTLMKAAGWIVWALLTLSILTEITARLRHVHPPELRGLAIPQVMARSLVTAAVALFLNASSTLTGAPDASAHPVPAAGPSTPAQPHHFRGETAKAKPNYRSYTVRKGDILSQLALDHLGSARRYPEIFNASRDLRQPGGARLTDPDEIDIGWTLHIPTEHPEHKNEHERRDPPKATNPPQAGPTPTPTPTPTPAPATAEPSSSETSANPAPAAVESREDADPAQPDWLLAGLAGAGAILAGSVWLELLRRRAVQHRHRRPGYVIAPPPHHLMPVDKTLRHQGQPASDLLTFIDEALRRLAIALTEVGERLPTLLAAEVGLTGIRLHLGGPGSLPEPWQRAEAESVWKLDVTDMSADVEPLEPDGPAPWPHLATVGADDAGRWWLINLEPTGIAYIGGDHDYATELARYLTAELATNPWSRDIQVDLSDVFGELAGLDSRRIRHHPATSIDDTISEAVHTIDRLNRLRLDDLPAARALQAGDEIWPSRVLVTTGTTPGHLDQLARLIREQPGRTGIAALILAGVQAGQPALEMIVGQNGRVRVPALGLDLIANGMTKDEAAGCVQLLQAADQFDNAALPSAGDEGWRQQVDQAGRLSTDLTRQRDPSGSADEQGTNLPQPDEVILASAATTAEDLAILAPIVPSPAAKTITESDPDLDQDLADWFADTTGRPRLSVLGPVRVRLGRGGQAAEAAKRKPYYTELVAYLATRPMGATTEQLCAAFAATPARLQRDLGVVRKWLGTDPSDGEPHLPEAARADEPFGTGPRTYRLHRVLYDADLFRRLRRRGQARGTDGLSDYTQAMALVTGSPYSKLHEGGGVWLADDRDDQHLLVAIVDTAHLAVTMALQGGDLEVAHRVARIAAMAAPEEEVPQLDLAAVAEASSDPAGTAQAIARLMRQRDSDGPIEASARATEVIDTRGWSGKARAG